MSEDHAASQPISPGAQPRRSTGRREVARALWYVRPGIAELRPQTLAPLQPGEARVRMAYSGLSRGTERLVFSGQVPESEHRRMRAPLQVGNFPFPVKYGYAAVGLVEEAAAELAGRAMFCFHPHQDVFNVPAETLVPVPRGVTLQRATLAANMETALNGLWDAGAAPGDRIVIVGAGVVGLLSAALCVRMPGAEVTLVDIEPGMETLARAMGARFALPDQVPAEADIVIHTSATSQGFDTALAACGLEATLLELSWYGTSPLTTSLGGAFHSRRVRVISSQVGLVAPSHRPRWSHRRRLEMALVMLADPRFDALVAREIAFDALPEALPRLFDPACPGLAPIVRYNP